MASGTWQYSNNGTTETTSMRFNRIINGEKYEWFRERLGKVVYKGIKDELEREQE